MPGFDLRGQLKNNLAQFFQTCVTKTVTLPHCLNCAFFGLVVNTLANVKSFEKRMANLLKNGWQIVLHAKRMARAG
jgi:hypothetical protein